MTEQEASRRTLLKGSMALGVSTLGGFALIRSLADSAVAAVPTASSRAALAASTGCATLTKEETQGPFWVDELLQRSDIRYDTGTKSTSTTTPVTGVPLTLTLTLLDAGGACAPRQGAYVDVWHANAQGAYSDVSGSGNPDETGHNFLRGYQVSDANGQVTFTTIFPGWYVSRTIHVHYRIRLALDSSTTVNFTSQLFFDDTVTNAVQAVTSKGYKGTGRDTTNSTDQLYDASLLVPLTGSTTAGYTGAFTVNLDFEDPSSSGGSSPTDVPTGGPGGPDGSAPPTGVPTATATTSPTSGTSPTTAATVVAASVRHAVVVKRRHRRTVVVTLAAQERITAKVRLLDDDTVLARTSTGWLSIGRRKVRLAIPARVPHGSYDVLVVMADKAGHTKRSTLKVTVPRR
ncbi:hypothetical protein [Nocardioides sp.]|uniref:dioxygenase family protein n=1 Tax=Nocardioides sp. TaxID=35761 RepID=UPI002630A60C|nr:hypothetical protein [Nocardioides sp.]